MAVLGTQRDPLLRALIWHQLEPGAANALQAGMEVQGCLDWELRHHTCCIPACICYAPLSTLVTGYSIAADKGRLDFDLPESTLDKAQITAQLNELIGAALEVQAQELPAGEYNRLLQLCRTRIRRLPTAAWSG